MEKKWLVLFVTMILSAGLLITVMSVSAAPTVKENPYENWVERENLKNCEIYFSFDAVYLSSVYGEESYVDDYYINFKNGKFNDSDNTFRVSNITEISYEIGRDVYKEKCEKKCEIVFDSGANNIQSFSASEISDVSNGKDSYKAEISIRGSGSHFPTKENWICCYETESGWVNKIDTKKTNYCLWGPKEMREYVKDIAAKTVEIYGGKCKTYTRELTSFKFDHETTHASIVFDGYLPRLRDTEGKCSWFGGQNDTGIDVTLRKEFYGAYLGEFGSNRLMSYEEFYKIEGVKQEFDQWMGKRVVIYGNWKDAGLEGTGLCCGPARELDTENDYFCAMRWHDNVTERYGDKEKPGHQHWWREQKIKVTNTANNISVIVAPVDWGPHVDTNRVIDLSKKAIETLGANTDTTIVKMCIVDPDTPLGLVTN